jgi:hypothetical protein
MRWAKPTERMRDTHKEGKILVEKPKGKTIYIYVYIYVYIYLYLGQIYLKLLHSL